MSQEQKTKLVKVNKFVEERKNWAKFGECSDIPKGQLEGTIKQIETEVKLESSKQKKKNSESETVTQIRKLGKDNKIHKRVEEIEAKLKKINALIEDERWHEFNEDEEKAQAEVAPAFEDTDAQQTMTAVRVSDISIDVTEEDLRELFATCGRIHKVWLAKDRETDENRGFAFVHYFEPSDAAKAISTLDGKTLEYSVLRVELAAPKVGPGGTRGGPSNFRGGLRRPGMSRGGMTSMGTGVSREDSTLGSFRR